MSIVGGLPPSAPGSGQLGIQQFQSALRGLGLEWYNDHTAKEMFEAIDYAAHNRMQQRSISPGEIAATILKNAAKTVEDAQVVYFDMFYTELTRKQSIPKLNSMMSGFDTFKDNTMAASDFMNLINKQLQITSLPQKGMGLLISRYRSPYHNQPEGRVAFAKIRRDIDLKSKGVNPGLLWACAMAEDFTKALTVNRHRDAPTFLMDYRDQARGTIQMNDFVRAC